MKAQTAWGSTASAIVSRCRLARPYLIALAIACGALSPAAVFATETECAPGVLPGADTGCEVAFDLEFRDVRRAGDINSGPDLGGTGHLAINFTGSAGAAGDTWITVRDADAPLSSESPASILLNADVLIHRFNNRKGAGLLSLFNEAPADKGLALILYDNGNTDALVLATVDSTGRLTKLASVPLGAGILDNVWYRLAMIVQSIGGDVSVAAAVFRHTDPSDPNSLVDEQRGQVGSTLAFSGPRPPGLQPFGEVGVIASAISAVVDSSVTNFLAVVLIP